MAQTLSFMLLTAFMCMAMATDYGSKRVVGGGHFVSRWGAWGAWSSCSRTCGRGTQTRSRTCGYNFKVSSSHYLPVPVCQGSSTQSRSCSVRPCPINGGWSSWSPYSSCSKSCGGGVRTRTRTCTYPRPAYGGKKCSGPSSQSAKCNTQGCPIDGGWTGWSNWSSCILNCRMGFRTRTRSCTNPKPQNGGSNCSGSSKDKESCRSVSYCYGLY